MVKDLKQGIKESYTRLVNEERLKQLDYQDLPRKGAKPIAKGDAKVTRVEVALSNADVPGGASYISKFAKKYEEFSKAKKEFEDLKKSNREKFYELFTKFFNPEDALLTRVIKTVGYSVILTKESKRENFDKAKFIELLKENFKDSVDVIEKLVEECKNITDVASTIDIETNESVVVEGKIRELISKSIATLKNGISKGITYIKSLFSNMDSRLKEMDKMLSPEQREDYDKFINKFKVLVTENSIDGSDLDKISADDNPFVKIGLVLKNALEKTYEDHGLTLEFYRPQAGIFIIDDGKTTVELRLSDIS